MPKPAPPAPIPPNVPPPPPPTPSIEAASRACDNALQSYKAAEQMRAAGRTDKQLENLDRAHEYYRECVRLGGQNPDIATKREQIKRPLADSYYREAMKAYYNQDLDLAIHLLRRVLEVDPEHRLAADNLQKAIYLKSKVPK
jgi:tetratricopeptide (TPR) repeat protein